MSVMSPRAQPRLRSDFPRFCTVPTRWGDNDVYGHVNNAVYYTYFDTVINQHLIASGALDIAQGEVIGLVVQTGCHYFAPLHYPDPVEVGLIAAEVGRTSVRYEVGLFAPGAELSAAWGHFVHVYVDRTHRKPTAVTEALRRALLPLQRPVTTNHSSAFPSPSSATSAPCTP